MGLTTTLRQKALKSAAKCVPGATALVLAKRYMHASAAFLDDHARKPGNMSVVEVSKDVAVLRHVPKSRSETLKRILIVPGHDGHYRQLLRLVRALTQKGAEVDILVFPGHHTADHTICSMREIIGSIQKAAETQGPYDAIAAHCVGSNGMMHALHEGLACDRVALISTPVDMHKLVRLGGAQYGLEGTCLDKFEQTVGRLGAPYSLETPWMTLPDCKCDNVLFVHAAQDWAAPLNDVEALAKDMPHTRLASFENGGHNEILNVTSAIAETATFLTSEIPQSAAPSA